MTLCESFLDRALLSHVARNSGGTSIRASLRSFTRLTLTLGGNLVFCGTPEDCAACEASYTGRFLRPLLTGGREEE